MNNPLVLGLISLLAREFFRPAGQIFPYKYIVQISILDVFGEELAFVLELLVLEVSPESVVQDGPELTFELESILNVFMNADENVSNIIFLLPASQTRHDGFDMALNQLLTIQLTEPQVRTAQVAVISSKTAIALAHSTLSVTKKY